jgi:two-component system sensor histidine kinase KdpD
VAAALVEAARYEDATQLVLGASRRSRWSELFRGSVINRVVRLSGAIDVHVISQEAGEEPSGEANRRPGRRPALPPRRRLIGWAMVVVLLPILTAVLVGFRDDLGLPTVLLLYLLLAVAVAGVGGGAPAMAAAGAGFLCANWYFTPPYETWTIAEAENVFALVAFLAVAGVVAGLVSAVARRAAEVTQARSEAETLARIAGTSATADPLAGLVDHVRDAFSLQAAALLARHELGWKVEASSGTSFATTPEAADVAVPVDDRLVLALTGGPLGADDLRVLRAFASSLAAAEDRRRLREEAGAAEVLAEANQLRSALLQAVSHDLRTPLASIKASISSLRQSDVQWSDADRESLMLTVEEETDRLTAIVSNLLDMSRISAGALQPVLRDVSLEEVIPAAVLELGDAGRRVDVDVPETLPPVRADPALLGRVIANLMENAVRHGGGSPVTVSAGTVGDRVHVRVVDRGPGIPRGDRERVFVPFQRLGDAGPGVGLGLAVASGFTHAMGGELTVEDTPGGGATMVVELERA